MQKYIYGVDFGTSNSALAILDLESRKVVKLFTIPSLLFFKESKVRGETTRIAVGTEAVELYVKNRMDGRFMKSIKKVLPNKSFVDTRIGAKLYKAEDLVALILKKLKDMADEFTGYEVKTAVMGRPVVFDENPERDNLAQSRLEKAARLVGFEEIYFQFEPVGAAYAYEREADSHQLVLVADFGGGTSDFSVMRLNPEASAISDRKKDMLGQGGIYIGGDSFDSDIMWHKGTPHFGRGVKEEFTPGKPLDLPLSYFQNICSWEKMNFLDTLRMKLSIEKSYFFSGKDFRVKNLQILIEENLGYSLFKEIEKAKINISNEPLVNFRFAQSGIVLDETITYKEFSDSIISENLDKIITYLDEFLLLKKIHPSEIDSVFMTGGTSLLKTLQEAFSLKFGSHKLKSGDNFNSVANGLAYSYWSLVKI